MSKVAVRREKLEVVPSFYYLGDCLSSCGDCVLASIKNTMSHEGNSSYCSSLAPLIFQDLQRKCLQFVHQERHAIKTWVTTPSDLHCLQCNNQTMIRRMCGVTTKNQVSWQDLLGRKQLDYLKVLRPRRLRWHGHITRSDGWLKKVKKLNPVGSRGRGRPNKTWINVIRIGWRALGLIPKLSTAKLGRLPLEVLLELGSIKS